jgi:hypothetical protein
MCCRNFFIRHQAYVTSCGVYFCTFEGLNRPDWQTSSAARAGVAFENGSAGKAQLASVAQSHCGLSAPF